MDWFGLCLDMLSILAQDVWHILFGCRLAGKPVKPGYFVGYLILLGAIQELSLAFSVDGLYAVTAQVAVLYGMGRWVWKNGRSGSWVAAILAVYISRLSFGLVNSLEAVWIRPGMEGGPLYLLLLLATLLALGTGSCCYGAVLRALSLEGEEQRSCPGMLLLPVLFFFAAQLYIMRTAYGSLPQPSAGMQWGRHLTLFLMQAIGLGALLCTLYAYRRMCRDLRTQESVARLREAVRAQRNYIEEAKMRYEKTRSFRHDIQNHLSVLDGLLDLGKLQEARAYLEDLEISAAALSFPYQTGNPVVDILLGEKLGLARGNGIEAEVSLILPASCGIADLDLCVIFANALDNAIEACRAVEGDRDIRIRGERQGNLYLLEFENTCTSSPMPPMGVGLSNIRSVAEKYHGAIQTEKADMCFRLDVLLDLSR